MRPLYIRLLKFLRMRLSPESTLCRWRKRLGMAEAGRGGRIWNRLEIVSLILGLVMDLGLVSQSLWHLVAPPTHCVTPHQQFEWVKGLVLIEKSY